MRIICFVSLSILATLLHLSATVIPTGLMTDLLENTQQVYQGGYPSALKITELSKVTSNYQLGLIRSSNPSFSWIVDNGGKNNVKQIAYQIALSDSISRLDDPSKTIWDSQRVESSQSAAILYPGEKTLLPNTTYHWKVRYWDNHGRESHWSAPKSFRTAEVLAPYAVSYYPMQKSDQYPTSISPIPSGYFADFGKDAFGQLRITLTSDSDNDTVIIHMGERIDKNRVERNPAGETRYHRHTLPLLKGRHTYRIEQELHPRHLTPKAVKLPAYIGNVTPFRYVEIEHYNKPLATNDITREMVTYPFNDNAAHFHSSNDTLNQIWNLCHYSMKATTFCGLFVDGERERIPYEADALINQLSYYSTDREFSIARRTQEYLLLNPTWPTEWILQATIISWYDYLYTGDARALKNDYELLKFRTLMQMTQPNNLISCKLFNQTKEFHDSLRYIWNSNVADIVDWPWPNSFGMKGKGTGETDNFVFTDYNTVVNAYHYEALRQLSIIAKTIGKPEEGLFLAQRAETVKKAINKLLFDSRRGIYKDGITTDHASLHGNMFPLAFEIVPQKHRQSVTDFVRSRKMACSVYGSQFLMDAIYNGFDAEYGLELLTSTEQRSWYNMLRIGSTISLEAWDDHFKPNQDWNHAWGAAPANTIARKLLGIEPLQPAFEHVRIRPQVGSLLFAEGKVPSIKGDFLVRIDNRSENYLLTLTLPANSTSDVWLPRIDKGATVLHNGKETMAKKEVSGKFLIVEGVGSGNHRFEVVKK